MLLVMYDAAAIDILQERVRDRSIVNKIFSNIWPKVVVLVTNANQTNPAFLSIVSVSAQILH